MRLKSVIKLVVGFVLLITISGCKTTRQKLYGEYKSTRTVVPLDCALNPDTCYILSKKVIVEKKDIVVIHELTQSEMGSGDKRVDEFYRVTYQNWRIRDGLLFADFAQATDNREAVRSYIDRKIALIKEYGKKIRAQDSLVYETNYPKFGKIYAKKKWFVIPEHRIYIKGHGTFKKLNK